MAAEHAWQFVSDHLPVGCTLAVQHAGTGTQHTVRFATWNVLETSAMHWIYKDEQRLNGSAITVLDKPSQHPKVTLRDEKVIAAVAQLCGGRDVVVLQEVSVPVLKGIQHALAGVGNFQIVSKNTNICVIFNSDVFVLQSHSFINLPDLDARRPVILTEFRLLAMPDGATFTIRLVSAHLNLKDTIRNEWARIVASNVEADATANTNAVTIALGDLNMDDWRATGLLRTAFGEHPDAIQHVSTYLSHVNTAVKGCCYDNVHYAVQVRDDAGLACTVRCDDPESVMPGIQTFIQYLSKLK